MEGNDLVVSPLEAMQKPERNVELERLIDEQQPFVELSELLIEVDGWTHFSDDFEHSGETEPRTPKAPLWGVDPTMTLVANSIFPPPIKL